MLDDEFDPNFMLKGELPVPLPYIAGISHCSMCLCQGTWLLRQLASSDTLTF